jgi:GMP synthase (glutamine-hydrolysing)
MRHLLIIKAGKSFPFIVRECGDFEDWIISGMEPLPFKVKVVTAYKNTRLPDYDSVSGVVVTGSHAMVTDREPWSERIAQWIPGVLARGIPFLGICYGHQLLAYSMGGVVGYHPKGREIGTATIRLNAEAKEDPLLSVLPDEFSAHVTHSQSVLKLPPGAGLLAGNEFEPHHVFRLGKSAWGLQFHPEFNARIMRSYIDEMTGFLKQEGLSPDLLRNNVAETPDSNMLLRRFVVNFFATQPSFW